MLNYRHYQVGVHLNKNILCELFEKYLNTRKTYLNIKY